MWHASLKPHDQGLYHQHQVHDDTVHPKHDVMGRLLDFCGGLPQNPQPQSNHEKHQPNPN